MRHDLYARMRELSSKFEGVETVDVGTLPRRVRREKSGSQLTSNKKTFPEDFATFPQVARTARAKATSLVRETRAKMGDLKGKASHAIVRLRVLAYEKHAASPVARLATPWYRQKSLGLLSPPHLSTTIARQSHHHF